MNYESKMYEMHSVIGDILYEAERGKITWQEACEQAKAEANYTEEEDDEDE